MSLRILVVLGCLATVLSLGQTAQAEDFCFLQVSDTHIEPQPLGSPPLSSDDRSVSTIGWVCQQAKEPQILEPSGIKTPRPAFVACTGDLMEFGNVGKTFESFEQLFKPLQIPLYLVPGNHDNTWAGVMQIMRDKYGGDHYSFDRFGCHFIFFDSATPQDPTPSIEQRTLTFLEKDLEKVKPDTPIFMFCHHPLSTTEYATPYEQLRFLEAIREHNVVALLMGHGHRPRSEKWGTLDSVMGGSTFSDDAKDDIKGYNIISVHDGILRVVYRFRDPAREMKTLLEKPIRSTAAPTLVIVSAKGGSARGDSHLGLNLEVPEVGIVKVTGLSLMIEAKAQGGSATQVRAFIDNREDCRTLLSPTPQNTFVGTCDMTRLTPGSHYLRIAARIGDVDVDRALPLQVDSSDGFVRFSTWRSAGSKAAPVSMPAGLLIADTGGELSLVVPKGGSKTLFRAGAEILHEPVVFDGFLYLGAGNGKVFCLSAEGRVIWTCPVGASTYGAPAVDSQRVYVADLQGFVHAIDRAKGKQIWSKPVCRYPIEQSILLANGALYFGAWDGFVYAVNAADGSVKWKSRCPAGNDSSKLANRYYAAADASPLIIGDRLFFADRAYHLGSYTLGGEYVGGIATGISGIGITQDGKCFYARGLESGLTKYDGKGEKIWNNPLPLGRFPIPPTEHDGKVYVCSNLGLLSAVDAASGKKLWQYQATPQLHVMAPIGVDALGRPCVAGMDGSVTCVGPK